MVVVPSRREGYGVAAREAMAYGRPVVASAVGGLLDAVEDGITGVLVPPDDVTALRTAMEGLLADRGRRLALGTAARQRAVATLSRELSLTRLYDALADAVSPRGSAGAS